ncbi:MAG: ATP-binding protein [Novosphingobium sp.]|nr:ATP-binding protein [Novosphingobium sp.]
MSSLASRTRRGWRRLLPPWPLTWQITLAFVGAMLVNGLLVSAAMDMWGDYSIARLKAGLSPAALRATRELEAKRTPATADLAELMRETSGLQDTLQQESNAVLYLMLALAALVTMAIGYMILGKLGRGLDNVAGAARRIAEGDLAARALPVRFASREERELIRDFNRMAGSLQRASRELSEGTAAVAHELRTPLTILQGRLQGISDGIFAAEPVIIDSLLHQTEALGRIVDDLLTLHLANAGRMKLRIGDVDLGAEAHRVVTAMAHELGQAGLAPVLTLAPAPIAADGLRLRQVISAVLSNACRYAAGSGPLAIGVWRNAGSVVLEIADRGPGLPPGIQPDQPFDRFWRSETSRNREAGGSGLGLAVVRAIVEAHEGEVSLRNRAEGGAVFTMTLPVQVPSA